MIDNPWFQSSEWHLALTLLERKDLMGEGIALLSNNSVQLAHADEAIQRWRVANHFDTDSSFAARIKSGGMTESEFGILLSLPVEALKIAGQNSPCWLEELSEAFFQRHAIPGNNASPGFLKVAQPLLDQFRSRLREGVTRIVLGSKQQLFDPQTVEEI